VIRLESVCKQHGGRILFLDASTGYEAPGVR
jgi:hypothetical protein